MPQKSSRSKKKSKKKSSSQRVFDKIMDDRMNLLARILKFRQFLISGFDPRISDSEIIVMFADVRGFTEFCRTLQKEMQDRKIQNFLRTYVRIFNEGLLQWIVENTDKRIVKPDPDNIELSEYIVPSMYKNLGDGMMMIWEIPTSLSPDMQGQLSHEIIKLVDYFNGRFEYHFSDLLPIELDSYSREVEKLNLGFGIAKGHAWRLDFGHTVDYAGSIINLASRLSSYARPKGVVSTYDVSPWFFDEDAKEGYSKIGQLSNIKGYDPVKVHMSRFVNADDIPDFKVIKPVTKDISSSTGRLSQRKKIRA